MKRKGHAVGFVIALHGLSVVIHFGKLHLIFYPSQIMMRRKGDEGLIVEMGAKPESIFSCDCDVYGFDYRRPILVPKDATEVD